MLRKAALFLLVAGPAWAQDELPEDAPRALEVEEAAPAAPRQKIRLGWSRSFDGTVRAGAGAIDGDTITPGRGAMSLLEGKVALGLDRGKLGFDVPLELSHRETFGAELNETKGSIAARGTWRLTPRLRLVGEVGLRAVWRPDWLDPFKPMEGGLDSTDRFSHWDRKAMAEVVARPFRRQRVRLRYDYTLAIYHHDEEFDPIYDPNHLTPWDSEQHRLDLVWRHRGDGYKLRAGAEAATKRYFFMLSRDKGTGISNYTTGGPPVNPLLELRWINPRVEAEVELLEAMLVLNAIYEYEIVDDAYQGYQSYRGHHPELRLSLALPRDLTLESRLEMFRRRYGPGSYAEGPEYEHPWLKWGTRREDWLGQASLSLRAPLAPRWTGLASAGWKLRRTNYPDYAPGVWPTTREYDFDWNYDNWNAWIGAETRF